MHVPSYTFFLCNPICIPQLSDYLHQPPSAARRHETPSARKNADPSSQQGLVRARPATARADGPRSIHSVLRPLFRWLSLVGVCVCMCVPTAKPSQACSTLAAPAPGEPTHTKSAGAPGAEDGTPKCVKRARERERGTRNLGQSCHARQFTAVRGWLECRD